MFEKSAMQVYFRKSFSQVFYNIQRTGWIIGSILIVENKCSPVFFSSLLRAIKYCVTLLPNSIEKQQDIHLTVSKLQMFISQHTYIWSHNHFVKTQKPKLIGQSSHISYISLLLYKMLFTVRKIYVFDKIVQFITYNTPPAWKSLITIIAIYSSTTTTE